MPQPETVVVNAIRKALQERWPSSWVVKVAGGPYQSAGIPDLVGCIEGRLVGLEVKAQRAGESAEHARGRATTRQLLVLRKIETAGGISAVVLSPEEAVEIVQRNV